jgi:mRNA-degrading endonuclease RelE of RelBE toxin-antitoxin system
VPREIRVAIGQLPPDTKRKVRAALAAVLDERNIGEPLRARLSGYRRIRIGRWRVVYRERAHVVEVLASGPRATVYEDLLARLRRR